MITYVLLDIVDRSLDNRHKEIINVRSRRFYGGTAHQLIYLSLSHLHVLATVGVNKMFP